MKLEIELDQEDLDKLIVKALKKDYKMEWKLHKSTNMSGTLETMHALENVIVYYLGQTKADKFFAKFNKEAK